MFLWSCFWFGSELIVKRAASDFGIVFLFTRFVLVSSDSDLLTRF